MVKILIMKVLLVSKIKPRLSHSSEVHSKHAFIGIVLGQGSQFGVATT